MASSSSFVQLSEDQIQCSICLDVFTDPVSTPCGHNFCRACLTKFWDSRSTCQCPLCKKEFSKRPELCVNTFISGLIIQFKESLQIKSSSPSKKSSAKHVNVPCDVCTDPKEEAFRSCLDCGMSFCEAHLEPHKTAAKLQKHKMINPVMNLDDYICQKHERAIELYCRDDQTCVCMFCTETDHKGHKTVLIEEESRQRKALMIETQVRIQKIIQDRTKKIEDIKRSVELEKKNADKYKADSIEVFRTLIHAIEKRQAELLEEMEEQQKATDLQAEGFIKMLEQDIGDLKMRVTELEQFSHTEEDLKIIKNHPSNTLSTLPTTSDWTNIHIKTEENRESLRRALLQVQELFIMEREKMLKVVPSLDTQKTEIQQLLNTCLAEGDTWYLVDSHWFKQWKKYVGFDSWDSYNVGDHDFYPGPVDNSGLLKDTDAFFLKEHLIEWLDYVLLPTEGWCKLISWYGLAEGQKPIARKVVTLGMFVKQCKVEVYLTELNLCECSDMDNSIQKFFSKADTISSIEKEMRSLFHIPDEKETRLWNNYMSNTFEPLNKPESTFQEAGLFVGQVVVIEQKNEDGTWPGVVGKNSSPGDLPSSQNKKSRKRLGL